MKTATKLLSAALAAATLLSVTGCDESAGSSSGSTVIPGSSASTSATAQTTTTFAENEGVNNAVENITVGLDDPDLEVTDRIKWMAHYPIDETTPAAILFKQTYGTPANGEDPESEGMIFEYTNVAYAERYDKLGAAIASGDSPDLFPFDNMDFPYGVLMGRYQPIDGIIDIDSYKWDATRDLMEMYALNGKHYSAFPEIAIYNLLYYRTSMIEEIGMEDPRELFYKGEWDWDTFLEFARAWQVSGEGRYVIDGYNPENDFLLSTGVPMIGNDGTKLVNNLNTPEVERAAALLLTLQSENLRYPRHELNSWTVNPSAWAKGNILFYGDGGTWVWQETLSKFAERFSWDEDEVKFVPFPKDPQADEHYVTMQQASYMWVKGSKNENGVKAWIDCNITASLDPAIIEAAKEQAIENFNWSRENIDFYYSLTALDGSSPVKPIVDFKGGLGAVSDGSSIEAPVQAMTNLVYLNGDSFVQLREQHNPAIQSAVDEINENILKS